MTKQSYQWTEHTSCQDVMQAHSSLQAGNKNSSWPAKMIIGGPKMDWEAISRILFCKAPSVG